LNALRVVLILAGALALQAGMGRLFPPSLSYFDALLAPLVVYGAGANRRSAMWVGCVSGLLADSWFYGGPFGLNGFKRTLLGWVLGGFSQRLDLGHPAGRFFAGAVVTLADEVLDLVLRGFFDAGPRLSSPLELLLKSVSTGLLVMACGLFLDRGRRSGAARRGF
jgi:rod shape-determining protein MreD